MTTGMRVLASLAPARRPAEGTRIREQRQRREERLRRQRGFTLIEMLVVISILGILAAVATLGMVGVTSRAHQRALDDEQMQIQSALNAMLMDQRLDPGDACPNGAGPTADLTAFPTGAPYASPPPGGAGRPVALYPHYLRGDHMAHRPYVCRPNGAVEPG